MKSSYGKEREKSEKAGRGAFFLFRGSGHSSLKPPRGTPKLPAGGLDQSDLFTLPEAALVCSRLRVVAGFPGH